MPIGVATSVDGAPIRLTEERWEHIINGHVALSGREAEVLEVISGPERVRAREEGELLAVRKKDGLYLVVVYREIERPGWVGGDGVLHAEAGEEASSMAKLTVNDDQPLSWSYDEGADVLYITFGDPRPSSAIDLGNVLVLEADGEMTGQPS
jgi:hypothetical protein